MVASESTLPGPLQAQLESATDRGLIITSFHGSVLPALERATEAAAAGRHDAALVLYERALPSVPASESLIRGVLLHDMALLADKAGAHPRAAETRHPEPRADGEGRRRRGPRARAQHDGRRLRPRGPAGAGAPERRPRRPAAHGEQPRADRRGTRDGLGAARARVRGRRGGGEDLRRPDGAAADRARPRRRHDARAARSDRDHPRPRPRHGVGGDHDADRRLPAAHGTSSSSRWRSATAWLGLGDLERRRRQYRGRRSPTRSSTRRTRCVTLWTRLAELYRAMGDRAYRARATTPSAFARRARRLRAIVLHRRDARHGSPLYADASFAAVRDARAGPSSPPRTRPTYDDNPAIMTPRARGEARAPADRGRPELLRLRPGLRAAVQLRVPAESRRATSPSRRRRSSSATSSSRARPRTRSCAATSSTSRPRSPARSVILEQRGVAEAQRGIDVARPAVQLRRGPARQRGQDTQTTSTTSAGSCSSWPCSRPGATPPASTRTTRSSSTSTGPTTSRRTSPQPGAARPRRQRTRISHELEAARLQRAIDSAQAAYRRRAGAAGAGPGAHGRRRAARRHRPAPAEPTPRRTATSST